MHHQKAFQIIEKGIKEIQSGGKTAKQTAEYALIRYTPESLRSISFTMERQGLIPMFQWLEGHLTPSFDNKAQVA